ncbi:hypothetical protein SHJG_1650 [Streptomyces hygroscopicus subsp. jinggangensis 5008]|nr:hypothetical protein SHJG_1650 [Streptomyces hygroscopicus subsp. jinggangensis 5008]AGF61080.1 hypothetical protein SHJGH_1414 [Streptomyces hygroscopicus subsp. jinggangensis TL01]
MWRNFTAEEPDSAAVEGFFALPRTNVLDRRTWATRHVRHPGRLVDRGEDDVGYGTAGDVGGLTPCAGSSSSGAPPV